MPSILVRVVGSFDRELSGSPGPGWRFLFSNDLALERYDDLTPGNGLPQNPQQRLAGTHSGLLTCLRVAEANDRFFPSGSQLWEYDATYKFNAVPNTPLQQGQVTARGLQLFDKDDNILEPPVRFAITGGTDAYTKARGQITEGDPTADDRLLVIQL